MLPHKLGGREEETVRAVKNAADPSLTDPDSNSENRDRNPNRLRTETIFQKKTNFGVFFAAKSPWMEQQSGLIVIRKLDQMKFN